MCYSCPDLEDLDLYGLSLLLLLNTIYFFFVLYNCSLVLRRSFMYICRDVPDTYNGGATTNITKCAASAPLDATGIGKKMESAYH